MTSRPSGLIYENSEENQMLEYTSDTRKIQELLDGDSGHVVLQNGVYDISRSLVIHDNTRLTLMPGAVLRLADGANTYLIVNDGYGKQADIGKKITKNVTIEGGVWDGNNVHQTRTSDEERDAYKEFHDECYYGMLTRFIGMEDFTLRDITIRNPEAYSMQISHVDRFTVEHIRFDYNMLRGNMDGVHINGPARNGRIVDIKGATNDDLVALNCDDVWSTEITHGPIENILVDGLWSDNGYTAVRLLSSGDPMNNVQIRNIFGTYRYYAVSFTHHGCPPGGLVWMDNISIDGVFTSKPTDTVKNPQPVIWFAWGTHSGNVTVRNVHRDEYADTTAPTIQIDPDASVDRLLVSDCTQKFHNCPEIPLIVNNGTIGKLITENVEGYENK